MVECHVRKDSDSRLPFVEYARNSFPPESSVAVQRLNMEHGLEI